VTEIILIIDINRYFVDQFSHSISSWGPVLCYYCGYVVEFSSRT